LLVLAVPFDANFEIKGTLQNFDSSAAFGLKFLYQPSGIQQELEIRDHINHRAKLL
jgi:hypothetical protein